MTPENLDLIAGWVSLVLTLMVFSYLLGDNFLYRIATHILVGAAAGYTIVVATESVVVPWINATVRAGGDDATAWAVRAAGFIPFLIGVMLLLKASSQYAYIGNMGLAYVIGVGVAVAIVGAVAGTIVPLAREAGELVGDDPEDGIVMLIGVVATLIYFQYAAVEQEGKIQRPRIFRAVSAVGRFFVMVTLGALYAGAILTSLAIFSDVIREQLEFIYGKVGG